MHETAGADFLQLWSVLRPSVAEIVALGSDAVFLLQQIVSTVV